MSDIKKVNDDNIPFESKVFTRWISNELKGVPNSSINDIVKDLSNGVVLVELAQVLTHKKAPHDWEQQPTTDEQRNKNCQIALKMFNNSGFKVNGVTPNDISANNEKQIISLIWQLISHYSIENSFDFVSNPKVNGYENNINSKLLSWAIKKTQTYKNVFAFKPYDLAMCALLDSYYPSKIKYYILDLKDHKKNFKLLIDVMNELGIPCLIYPEDFTQNFSHVDQKALLAQLSIVRNFLEVKPHMREIHYCDSVIQKKFDSKIANRTISPKRVAEKKLMLGQENLLHRQIQARRKANSELGTTKEKADFVNNSVNQPIPVEQKSVNVTKNNIKKESTKPATRTFHRNINKKLIKQNPKQQVPVKNSTLKQQPRLSTLKPKNPSRSQSQKPRKPATNQLSIQKVSPKKEEPKTLPTKEQQEIAHQISEEFKENEEAFKERKQEEQEMRMNNIELLDEKKKIEKQIADEFRENVEAFNERKQEEKIQEAQEKQPTKEQIAIQHQLSEEFKENQEAFNERKQEERIEAEKQEKLDEPIEHQISEEFKENIENFNERKQEEKIAEQKENQPTKEQLEIQHQISEEFNENKEAFNERKQEEKIEAQKQERIDEPIEHQISEEFKENIENFNERKQEEKIAEQKENQPTKEQIEIQHQISEEFKENKEEFLKRKQEEKMEKEKMKKDEERKEGIKYTIENRPEWKP